MDGRSSERGSGRGPETGTAPQTRKTRRELRAEREAAEREAERGRTGEHPTQPGQPAFTPGQAPPDRPQPERQQTGPQSTQPVPQDRPGPSTARAKRSGSWFDQPADSSGPQPQQPQARQNPQPPSAPAKKQAPRPWDEPEPQQPRAPERPERGPLEERFPVRPTPFAGVRKPGNQPESKADGQRGGFRSATRTSPKPDQPEADEPAPPLAQIRESALRSAGMPPNSARRDRGDRLRPSPDEEAEELYDAFEDEYEEEEPEPRKQADPRKRRRTAVWLFGVSLLLVLWSATMFVDSASPLFTLPSAIVPLVTICSLPVIAFGLSGKHWVSTGITAVAALLPWAMVVGYASSRDSPPGDLSMVRVLTVEGSHGAADADSITETAREYAADVVIVTGLNTTLAHDLTVAGLDQQAPAQGIVQVGSAGSNGIGIWSRLAVSDLTELEGFSKPAASGVLQAGSSRVGMTIAQMPGGTLMPGAAWRNDMSLLAQQNVEGADTGSFLVGDLNASPWQPAFRALEKAGWEDAADVAGKGLRPTWPAWSPLPVTPADHLLVDQGIGVSSTAAVDIAGSSHRALVVSLEVPTG
ncbi:endonuclease/exonuclease/phosphatase family protein [Kineosporia babensis]|uniref:Endonuclease/exonuclease/phosphatase domain-containing protein n=1 Tax=Kineosporia babensis TaxID=499548 RepID=A0A9X1NGD0_9ACTN|nr:endonuclease/exonuclease/phosphatase family protein [Kineosporia babensis]MCD5313613.1 hypothetical protein [Kineosporia babensis]